MYRRLIGRLNTQCTEDSLEFISLVNTCIILLMYLNSIPSQGLFFPTHNTFDISTYVNAYGVIV